MNAPLAPSPPQVAVSKPLGTTFQQTAAYVLRPEVLHQWMGKGASVVPRLGRYATLPDGGDAVRPGRVLSQPVRTRSRLEIVVTDLYSSPTVLQGVTTFRITARANNRSIITIIDQPGLTSNDTLLRHRLRVWQQALNKLGTMIQAELKRRERVKQAVIVVHGIGEQLPGQTLRSFAKAVFPGSESSLRVKPDSTSSLFELRKITVDGSRSENRPTTDIYELYWAHLIRDTQVGQVAAWVLKLMVTPVHKIPRPLRLHVSLLWIATLLAVVVTVLVQVFLGDGKDDSGTWGVKLGLAVLGVLGWFVIVLYSAVKRSVIINAVGDAARYLRAKPDNIAVRQAIRDAGVNLLQALHESREYDRIVVFGHSLGSVIAYDILTFAWIRFGRWTTLPDRTRGSSLRVLERETQNFGSTALSIQPLQYDAWKENRRNGSPWLVSDFVTAGSPLTHADLLLALDNSTSFDALKNERVYPTCPPATESDHGNGNQVFSYTHSYRDVSTNQNKTQLRPNHAALFGFTRWTNLYFPFSRFLNGDPIGGPLQEKFGRWISDTPLAHPGSGFMGFAHTMYWDDTTPNDDHIAELRASLRMNELDDLRAFAKSLPFY